jgi:beta-lactamase class D
VTKDESLATFFDTRKVSGAFGLFDNGAGRFFIYNLPLLKDSTYNPSNTFDIVTGLVGLQTGIIPNEKTPVQVPGTGHIKDDDTIANTLYEASFQQAFTNYVSPYFYHISRQLGKDTLQYWLDSIGYGASINDNDVVRYYQISQIDSFWTDGSLRISGDIQLGLMKKLYFNQLPFQQRAQTIVKQQMQVESNSNYSISYRHGTSMIDKSQTLYWLIGWIEENKHPYFFVLQVIGKPTYNLSVISKDILFKILDKYGFLKGKK